MNKIGLFILVIGLGAGFSSCKKKGCTDATATNFNSKAKKDDGSCLYKPMITIIGAADTTISVGSTYADLGATAVNKDGSSVNVVTTGQVVTTSTGVNYVNYSATNPNGTSTAKRTVNVVIGQDNWTVAWDVTSNCGATSFPLAGAPTISAGAKLDFDRVLLLDNDGKIQVGAPAIAGAVVSVEVNDHVKGDKVIVFKKKRRKGYKKKNGHRQSFTSITIKDIKVK